MPDGKSQDRDHYEIARDKALSRLQDRFERGRIERLGAKVTGKRKVELPCLAWRFGFTLDPYSAVVLPSEDTLSMKWQILSLEYLAAPVPAAPGEFVSFAQFPETRTYKPTFDGRVLGRLSHGIGTEREKFVECAERCDGAMAEEDNPCTYLFKVFPRFELQVTHHKADEEFPAACNVLFPDNALEVLSPESIVVAAEMLTASLEGKQPAAS